MTSPLRDAAESATAGVPVVAYRTDIFENLPNGKLSRLILEAGEVSEPDPDWTPLVRLSELDTARAEIERLRTALTFYQDGFTFIIDKRRPGLAWVPTEKLLDDCGNIARIALADEPATAATLSPAVKEPK